MKTFFITFLFSILVLCGFSQAPSSIKGPIITCSGPQTSLTYTASLSNPSFGDSLVWSILPTTNVTLFNAHDSTVQVFPNLNAVGTYTIYCKRYDNLQVNTETLALELTVLETPNVTFSGANTFCQGSSTNLQASTTIQASSTVVYSWSPSYGLNTTSGNNVTANPAVQTTYTVTSTTGSCNSINQITISPYDALNVTFSGANTFCQGSSTSLQASSTIQSGSSTVFYNWAPAFGLNTTIGANVTANPSVATTYTLMATSGNCFSKTQVTVAPFETIAVNFSGATTFCNGQTTNISINSPIIQGSSTVTYSWSPFTGLDNPFSSHVEANPSVSTTYTVTASLNGQCSNTGTITIGPNNINPAVISVTQTDDTLCYRDMVMITASGADTYTWSSSIQNGVPFEAFGTETYYVQATDINGCISDYDSAKVYVDMNAYFNLTSSPPSLQLAGESATLTINNYFSNDPSILYYINGVLSSTATVVSPTVSTTYTITSVNPNGCDYMQTYFLYVGYVTGVDAIKAQERNYLDVYPNPNNGIFTIRSSVKEIIQIINQLGEIVRNLDLNPETEQQVSDLSSGIYVIHSNRKNIKIIVTQ